MIPFSLVLTTYYRFESFLKNNVNRYLENPYIREIIIYDDCSDDFEKINHEFKTQIECGKIKVFRQEKNRGALRNKIMALEKANEEWICLMDSDNYCNISYFEKLERYWNQHGFNKHMIYAPEGALPVFQFSNLTIPVNQKTWNKLHQTYGIMLNAGNYVLHKSMVPYMLPILDDLTIEGFVEVKYMNYRWVRDANATIQVIPGMTYEHTVHNGSLYMRDADKHAHFDKTFNWTIDSESNLSV
jgi:glycosyltransferase involved in cell wall biosynthesis